MPQDTRRNITNIIVTGKSGAGKQPRIDVLKEEYTLEQLSTGDIFRRYLRIFNEYGYKKSLTDFWDTEKNTFISDEKIARKLSNNDKDIILGLKAKYFVDKGLFVPDSITNALFEAAFSEKKYQKQILDGYPRTLDQAIYLLDLIKKQCSSIDFIVLVDNSDDRIISRTVQRRICPNCGKVYHLTYKPPKDGKCEICQVDVIQRSDDTEEKIKSRLNEYQEKAVPAINYLKEQGIPVITVPGHLESFTMENVRKSVMDEIEKLYVTT
ncbi:MAG: nucleoside monophosphate kinase [Candidatus Thermoplasmatota archaeon]|nr:nucleoside monophosphate kinase [Candidatus Thermoplasmatota archaeon]